MHNNLYKIDSFNNRIILLKAAFRGSFFFEYSANTYSIFYLIFTLTKRTDPMKSLTYLAAILLSSSAVYLAGCKADETPPTITINGDAHVITAKDAQYTDAGATASDNKDDKVYVISDISNTNPDINIAGDYTVTYTAQDRAANTSTATRLVSVTYTNWQLNHHYNVTDICTSDTTLNAVYVSSVYIDTNYSVFRTDFTNMSNFFTGYTYTNQVGNHVSVPKQKPDGTLSPFQIEGSGTVSDSAGIIVRMELYYTIKDTTNTLPIQNRHASFVSF